MSFPAIYRLTHASVLEMQAWPLLEGDAYQREQGKLVSGVCAQKTADARRNAGSR